MNERINELIKQSYVTVQSPSGEGYTHFSQEKFAELIVKECISALEEKIHRSIDNEGDEIWADLILKEHFGVEE
jgi:hypothetical protein